MAIKDGLYGVRFVNGTVDFGSGTVALRAGALNGGDHGFRYQGRVEATAMAAAVVPVSGHIQVHRWNSQVPSVVPGVNDYRLDVTGQYDLQAHVIDLQGTSPAFPGHVLKISGTWLADLVE